MLQFIEFHYNCNHKSKVPILNNKYNVLVINMQTKI